jgi:hypothetical protein
LSGPATSPLGSWVADNYEVVAQFEDLMPTGVTVTDDGRVFVSFPRWGDEVPYTVAEVVDGKAVPYPSPQINAWSDNHADRLVSVQSVITTQRGTYGFSTPAALPSSHGWRAGPRWWRPTRRPARWSRWSGSTLERSRPRPISTTSGSISQRRGLPVVLLPAIWPPPVQRGCCRSRGSFAVR